MTEKPKRIKDQTGKIYGNWKVIEFHEKRYQKSGKVKCYWMVENIKTGERRIKDINTLYQLQYAKDHPDKMNKWQKKWVSEHRDEWNAKTLENYYKNKERNKANQKAYYEKNKERLRAYGREYMRNRDKSKVYESIEKYKARRDNDEILAGQTCKAPQTYLGKIFDKRHAYRKPDAPVSKRCDIEFRRAYARGEKYEVTAKSVTIIDKVKNWFKKK